MISKEDTCGSSMSKWGTGMNCFRDWEEELLER